MYFKDHTMNFIFANKASHDTDERIVIRRRTDHQQINLSVSWWADVHLCHGDIQENLWQRVESAFVPKKLVFKLKLESLDV